MIRLRSLNYSLTAIHFQFDIVNASRLFPMPTDNHTSYFCLPLPYKSLTAEGKKVSVMVVMILCIDKYEGASETHARRDG